MDESLKEFEARSKRLKAFARELQDVELKEIDRQRKEHPEWEAQEPVMDKLVELANAQLKAFMNWDEPGIEALRKVWRNPDVPIEMRIRSIWEAAYGTGFLAHKGIVDGKKGDTLSCPLCGHSTSTK